MLLLKVGQTFDMPLYEYQCDACGHRFEMIRKFSDPAIDTCPDCGGAVKKLLSSPAIQFKGSGWYITDYAKKSSDGASGKSDSEKSASDKSSSEKSGEKSGTTASSSDSSTSTSTSTSDSKE